MLEIEIPGIEKFDDETQEFIYVSPVILRLEHSLISISKWESKWNKPFLSSTDKSVDETIDYIKCMTLNKNINNEIYDNITNSNVMDVMTYIQAPMTATTFNEQPANKTNREIITSELIYYWMISLNIPSECQRWHLNRLLTLIRVCDIKNNPSKKMNKKDLAIRNAALNAARKKQLNTKG